MLNNIQSIPRSAALVVMSFLEMHDLLSAASVCKSEFFQAANGLYIYCISTFYSQYANTIDDLFWKDHILHLAREFDLTPFFIAIAHPSKYQQEQQMSSAATSAINYKNFFVQLLYMKLMRLTNTGSRNSQRTRNTKNCLQAFTFLLMLLINHC